MVTPAHSDDRPDIVIAGFPKAGTTALATLLAGHSQVSLIEPKEPHRFSWGLAADLPDHVRATALSATAYRAAIATARRNGRLVIDASTSYSHPAVIEGTARRLKDASPDLPVILMVRDPVKRLVSDWGMRHAEGWAKQRLSEEVRGNLQGLCASVGAANDEELVERLAGNRDWIGPDRPVGRGTITVVAAGFYDPLVAVYRDLFGERLLVVPQEALRRDQARVLARCYAHLGLVPEPLRAGPAEFNVGDHRVETGLSRLLRRIGVAWAARALLPHHLVARVRHQLTRTPEPGIDDLVGSPEGAVVERLYDLLSAQTRAQVEGEFGVRWGPG